MRFYQTYYNEEEKIPIGISLPLSNSSAFNPTFTTKDTIKSNLINFLLTDKQERYFNNQFGSNIRKFLFELSSEDNINELKSVISSGISQYFSNIKINTLNIIPNDSYLNIYIDYTIISMNDQDQINITFNNE